MMWVYGYNGYMGILPAHTLKGNLAAKCYYLILLTESLLLLGDN